MKYKFCLWLVDILMIRPLTLAEIQDKWQQASVNGDGDILTERTFNRYRRDTEELMQVEIECDKRSGNKYFIANKNYLKGDKMAEWILTSYRLRSLSKNLRKRSAVIMDPAPPAAHLLEPIMHAIDNKNALRFIYKSHFKEPKKVHFIPAFVRLCHHRWYVIGVNLESLKQRVYAFERIQELHISEDGSSAANSLIQEIMPSEYFANSYGVINEGDPTLIEIRAFWPQDAYLKDVPLHHSQEVIRERDGYTDFQLYVRPSYDFIQALLSNREKVIVLEPIELRTEILSILEKMQESYKTGVYCGE